MVETDDSVKSLKTGLKNDSKNVCGFGVNDAPLWVYKGIAEPAQERFNGTYWIRIAELLQLEQAYYELTDAMSVQRELIEKSTIPPGSVAEQAKIDNKESKPKYLGQK
jgi:hypothetical protein